MSPLKIYLIFLLVSILVFGISCKTSIDPDPTGDIKIVYNIEITYERPIPFKPECYDKHINLYIGNSDFVNMKKIAKNKFEYIAPALEAYASTCIFVQDSALISVGGEEFNARIIKVNGTELTDIRNDPDGNDNKVAYFTIDENGTVI